MAFGTATVLTVKGRAMFTDRLKATPSTYTNPPKYIGIGTGATGAARTAVAADTALTTEVESRATGVETTVTTTSTGDTYQTVGTITMSGSRAIDEAGTFDASSTGNMSVSATFAAINLNSGDQLQLTVKSQIS